MKWLFFVANSSRTFKTERGNHRLESAGLDAVKGRYWGESFFYIGELSEVEGFGKFAIRWHNCAI
jgi:hypothetical protein